jgi:ribosomal protein L11 methyltransferase
MGSWPALDISAPETADLFQAALMDYNVAAVDESTRPGTWRVFFHSDADRKAAAQALGLQFTDLIMRTVDVPDEDWVEKSQAALKAVQIGNTIVAPPWDVPHTGKLPVLPDDATGIAGLRRPLVIVIKPSTGFGTGHHATTSLCLTALQQVDLKGCRVVDVGTGSGLLAIAASRLGASHVLGIDEDPNAFRAAQENLTLNRGADVSLRLVDVRSIAIEPFDIVLANLTGTLLREAAARLKDLAGPGARMVLSGFTRDEESDVLSAYSELTVTTRTEQDEWVCVTLQRR